MVLELAEGEDPEAALQSFLTQDGVQPGRSRSMNINGLPAAGANFDILSKESALKGDVVFVRHGGQLFSIMGIGTTDGWSVHQPAVDAALSSFDRVTDPGVLNKQPNRMEIIRLPRDMTLEEFYAAYASPLELEQVGRMNRWEPGETLTAGTLVKHVAEG